MRCLIASKASLKGLFHVDSVFFFSSSQSGAVKEQREGTNGDRYVIVQSNSCSLNGSVIFHACAVYLGLLPDMVVCLYVCTCVHEKVMSKRYI